ncbi:hypothetical protein [Cryobacterium serini]|uniref:hypothetical protein n=1 Tax=Cryobacterium serini TaxID=1259201 RepID=UPI00158411FF|nr:hypothetical protein [Cryobacterium serini]
MIIAIIIGCEVGFWVLIVLGLVARYVLGLKKTGLTLLAMTPIVDIILLVTAAMDLISGATATIFHGIAAIYLGFSVAYGHKMITRADLHFAHRFAKGSAPIKLYGPRYAVECWKDVARTGLAVTVALGTIWLLTLVVDSSDRTSALNELNSIFLLVFCLEVVWALGYTLWPKKLPTSTRLVNVDVETTPAQQTKP